MLRPRDCLPLIGPYPLIHSIRLFFAAPLPIARGSWTGVAVVAVIGPASPVRCTSRSAARLPERFCRLWWGGRHVRTRWIGRGAALGVSLPPHVRPYFVF